MPAAPSPRLPPAFDLSVEIIPRGDDSSDGLARSRARSLARLRLVAGASLAALTARRRALLEPLNGLLGLAQGGFGPFIRLLRGFVFPFGGGEIAGRGVQSISGRLRLFLSARELGFGLLELAGRRFRFGRGGRGNGPTCARS